MFVTCLNDEMVNKKQGLSLVAVFLLSFAVLGTINLQIDSFASGYSPYVAHYSNIYIWENGTITPSTAPIQQVDDKYILTGDVHNGISLQKSNVTFDGNGHKIYGYRGTGLLLQNVTNVSIQNLGVLYFSYGIYLDNSHGCTLKYNNLTNCGIKIIQSNDSQVIKNISNRVISIEFSSNGIVTDNRASGISVTWSKNITIGSNVLSDATLANSTVITGVLTEGISIDNSADCNIFGNTIERKSVGINIWYSTNLTFTGNTLNDNQFGFKLLGNTLQTHLQDIDTSNTINGKPVYFLVNKTDYQVPNSAGWIAAVNCKGITVQGWTSTPNWDGILFAYTTDSKIVDSELDVNFNALRFSNASNIVVTRNILSNNQYAALYFEKSSNCKVIQNNVINNMCFFYLWNNSTNNTLTHNNFVGNWTGSIDKDLDNKWDNGKEGNYWSCFTGVDLNQDGISDSSFLIDTHSEEKDLYPLTEPYGDAKVILDYMQTNTSTHLAMPEEYINYTITNLDGVFWARIDGLYPMHFTTEDNQPLLLFYPVPPNTTNIQVKLDGREIGFSDYSEIDPKATHYTDIGSWAMIYCTLTPTKPNFLVQIHYEHPLEVINGSYTFLYDLNISPYLSNRSINSVAHFTVRIEEELPNLNVYTTGFTGEWTPVKYTATTVENAKIMTFNVISEYDKPLLGDVTFVFSDSIIPELTIRVVMFTLIAVTTIIYVYSKKRNSEAPTNRRLNLFSKHN